MSREQVINRAITSGPEGEIWECGTFRGEMAAYMLSVATPTRTIRLFDTFVGQPFSGPHDIHQVGSMNETSLAEVEVRFAAAPNVHIHPGIMPDTFVGLDGSSIAVVNIDVDNHDSVRECLTFVYPRVPSGGYIILDDYGCGSCPGAKIAVDNFLADKPERLSDDRQGPQAYFIKV